jgi:Bacterial protein of unknown function (DUF903)
VKTTTLIFLSGVLLLSGCARNYVITLNNGSRITATNKPKMVHGAYVFKDASGQDSYVPAGRVTEIGPASEEKEEKSQYKATPVK